MKSREAVCIRIEILCERKGINFSRLAYRAGIPPTTLKNILYGVSKNPGIVTITKLCNGLDMSVIDFFSDELFEKLEQEIE
ncbi:MAG: helix-turn-helix transcriptional regulator [Lachnospiraceae bacterium]